MGKVWTFSTSQTGLRVWKRQEKPFIGSARSTGDLGSKYYTEKNPSSCCVESAFVFSPTHPRLQDVGKERIIVSGCFFGNSSVPHWATSNAHLYLSILWASHFKDSQYWILLEPEAISYKCILSSSLRWKHFLSKIQHFVVTSIFPRNFLSGTLLKSTLLLLNPSHSLCTGFLPLKASVLQSLLLHLLMSCQTPETCSLSLSLSTPRYTLDHP